MAGQHAGSHAQPRRGGARRADRSGSRRSQRGRRSTTRSRRPLLLVAGGAAAAVAVAGTGLAVLAGGDEASAAACGGQQVTVAAAPEIAPALHDVLDEAGCTGVDVDAVPPAEVAASLSNGRDAKTPDLWIPDSSLWRARVAVAPQGPGRLPTLVDSVAASPVVIAGTGERVPTTWKRAVLSPGFVTGDPLDSVSAAAPVVVAADGARRTPAALVGFAQSQAGVATEARDARRSDGDRLTEVQDAGGLTAVSEQQWLALAPALTAATPQEGTLVLDFPVLVTADQDRVDRIDATTAELARLLGGRQAGRWFAAAGFRAPGAAPTGDGVGYVRDLPVKPRRVAALLADWSRLARPARALAVIDVSGSMEEWAGTGTRLDVTVAAARHGLALFPGSAALGLWAFSQADDGELDGDHAELVPVRPLAEAVDGRTQEDVLGSALDGLGDLTGGGTSLHDTTLAAYEAAQESYDPDAANSVMILTDGTNDDPGSPGLDELVAELEQRQDPERPVRVIAIGITADADASALRAIADATGGKAYVAESPEDITRVFGDAVAGR